MRIMKYLSMAAFALMGAMTIASCDNEDNALVEEPVVAQNNIVTVTTTISLEASPAEGTTRALNPTTGAKTFAVGDKVALVYKNTSNENVKVESAALKDDGDITDGGKTAKLTFTLEDPKTGTAVLVYPASFMLDANTLNTAGIALGQDGTLATLQKNFDASFSISSLTVDGSNATFGDVPTMTNPFSICKFTVKDDKGTAKTTDDEDITSTITQLTITNGAASYVINREAAAGPIYVAMLPTSGDAILTIGYPGGTGSTNFSFTASDGTNSYTKSVSGKALASNTIYPINVTMTKPENIVDLSMVDCAGTARASRWTANCYMIHTAGNYKLPLVYGNAIKNGAANAVAYTGVNSSYATQTFPNHAGNAINAPWITKSTTGEGVDKGMGITVNSAELLWQDATGLITSVGIDGDFLMLTVGKDATTQEGNAVIAAKDGDGNIVWSWHIWVTKQTFATLTSVDTGNHAYSVTPVNLGWVGEPVSQGYCTYYQWGRKDAFIPSMGTENTNHTVYNISNTEVTGLTYTASTTATIADNIKNPTTFFYNSTTGSSCTTKYYNMWDAQHTGVEKGNVTTATNKTIYDPCPPGFCVPTGNLFYSLYDGKTFSTAGATWDATNKICTLFSVSFPASGSRLSSTGASSNVGVNGYYWSASAYYVDNDAAGTFWFNTGTQYVYWTRAGLASGRPVRAVAEE